MGGHALLQEISLTGTNPCLLCLLSCRQILYHWVTGEAQSNGICFQKLPNKEILCPVYYVGEFLHRFKKYCQSYHVQIFLENRLRGYLIMYYIHWVFKINSNKAIIRNKFIDQSSSWGYIMNIQDRILTHWILFQKLKSGLTVMN